MKILVLAAMVLSAASITTLSGSASADADNIMHIDLGDDSVVKFVIPAGMDPDDVGCYSKGNEAAANQFFSKYGRQEVIWADQYVVEFQHGGTVVYRNRLSANVNGTWIHQFYKVTETYEHSCYVNAALVGESRD